MELDRKWGFILARAFAQRDIGNGRSEWVADSQNVYMNSYKHKHMHRMYMCILNEGERQSEKEKEKERDRV